VLVFALARSRDCSDDLELRLCDCFGDVLFVLAEEAPEDGGQPCFQPGTYVRVDVVLVVPQLVGELLALRCQCDGNDNVGESLAEFVTG
jgi:hypothetical protein